ncbi:LpqN/LpqT family lipoprotein [Antrihabitans cavernicola]|uniref:Lipoprotein LpqN n=1 Tax=Antrihabitans cavernicola TaxID=2495913 RepID=A0A5A7S8B3_9NOCA|nr:LpqN/LpqT family lipoprotein [Spelaeibacter cavernicola]KAA0020016.1 hypothetical protein FOY51_21880 [Spelaeibacter cavernicola]
MKYSKIGTATVAAAAMAVSLTLVGCSSDSKDSASTATSSAAEKSTTAKATESASGAPKSKLSPREATTETAGGANYSIADYIKDQKLVETPIHRGDPGAPTIDLPFPDGWKDAGSDAPDWAYGAIVYTGPEAAEYTPSIVAIVSKLEGNVDPQKLIDNAPGELKNLPGFTEMGAGSVTTLGNFPAYQLGGTFDSEGQRKVVAQKTVVIPGKDGLYILQLNADGLEDQLDVIGGATVDIDDKTTITP